MLTEVTEWGVWGFELGFRGPVHKGCLKRCVLVQVNGGCIARDDAAPIDLFTDGTLGASYVERA